MSKLEKGKINIRPMTRSDIHAVLALDRKAGKARGLLSYKDMVTTDPGGPLDMSFIAEEGDEIIGFIMTRLAYVMIPFTEVCVIQGILVDTEYQDHGVGGMLLDHLLDYCKAEGISTVRALVEGRNDALRRFIERHGFHRSTVINYDRTFES
jgi:ribosomal protein S18 acetylase RimI-like enzyme